MIISRRQTLTAAAATTAVAIALPLATLPAH